MNYGNKNFMICLSKNKTDEYINMYAKGAGLPIHDYSYEHENKRAPILIRSLGKRKLIHKCWETKRDFYYMDSGYLGNYKSPINEGGWKVFHRIVKNDIQHSAIIERPSDRWEKLGIKIDKRKKTGRNILLVMPSDKPCKFYGIDAEKWKQETIEQIKMHTDRPIVIREKQPRHVRMQKTIYQDLDNAYAMVTYQSIAAVESVLYGIPAFTLAPTAADPVANKFLYNLENPERYDKEYIYSWACHIAYGQFHIDELKKGKAHNMIMEELYGS
jgi:hypothetical protein